MQNYPQIPSCSEQTMLLSLCMATPWQWFLLTSRWQAFALLTSKITGFVWIMEVFSNFNQSRIAKGQKKARSELCGPWGFCRASMEPFCHHCMEKDKGLTLRLYPQIHNPTVQCIYNHT